jgi:hypothetical protein
LRDKNRTEEQKAEEVKRLDELNREKRRLKAIKLAAKKDAQEVAER